MTLKNKHIIFTFLLFFLCSVATPNEVKIDSIQVQKIIDTGLYIANNNQVKVIPFLPNEVTASLLTAIVGAVIRFIEKRRLIKRLKDDDFNPNN